MDNHSRMQAAYDLRQNLMQYTGTYEYHSVPLNTNIVMTDGVKAFADAVGGYWLLDILATQPEILNQAKDFAFIKLRVHNDNTAELFVTDGGASGQQTKVVYTRHIDWTDCLPGVWTFYFVDNTILLPGEY